MSWDIYKISIISSQYFVGVFLPITYSTFHYFFLIHILYASFLLSTYLSLFIPVSLFIVICLATLIIFVVSLYSSSNILNFDDFSFHLSSPHFLLRYFYAIFFRMTTYSRLYHFMNDLFSVFLETLG